MKTIPHEKLICMHDFVATHPLVMDVAYAREDNYLFGERVYRPDARIWLYEDLAQVVLRAAEIAHEKDSVRFVLYDGLRTVDAQEKMLKTNRVADNPHWLQEPRLLSPPGAGGHPRGMAIDIGLMDEADELLDMGTVFDDLSEAAHRDYPVSAEVAANRALLTDAMVQAAEALGVPLLPLPQEWWDFRLLPEISKQYVPLRDSDLPPEMRMVQID